VLVGSAIGMLFSMGSQELPSVISAGVGAPKTQLWGSWNMDALGEFPSRGQCSVLCVLFCLEFKPALSNLSQFKTQLISRKSITKKKQTSKLTCICCGHSRLLTTFHASTAQHFRKHSRYTDQKTCSMDRSFC
jgi:hypothetical protein